MPTRRGPGERRDNAAGHRLADAERVADREHEITDLERVQIADRQDRQLSPLSMSSSARSAASSPPTSCARNSRRSEVTTMISSASSIT